MQIGKKKKILFLSFNYPYGSVGASTMCSFQIMKSLCASQQYEVHCISYEGETLTYEYIPDIVIHKIQCRKQKKQSKLGNIWKHISYIITYPIQSLYQGYIHYKSCKHICSKEKFDIVIAQYFPEQCLLAGILLKKKKIISNLIQKR